MVLMTFGLIQNVCLSKGRVVMMYKPVSVAFSELHVLLAFDRNTITVVPIMLLWLHAISKHW
jgi:hypothetical protein